MSQLTVKRNSRLLIVDDNRSIHADFQKILAPKDSALRGFEDAEAALFGEGARVNPSCIHQFQLDSAYQGDEGLARVKQALDQGQPYAMAFMDVRMPPGCDGVEATAKIWEVDPDLQVVMCTAYSDWSWDEMLHKLGQSDRLVVLKKPFDSIEVLQLANSLCRKWQLLQESKGKMAILEEMVLARTAQVVQEQEKLKAIFDNSPEGIFQTDAAGRYLTANPALARIYGYASPKELMEQLTDIQAQLYVDPNRRSEFQKLMTQHSVLRDFESEIKCKDGVSKWISETACRVNKLDGSLQHYQGFVVEITAQKKAQKERDLMETHLRQAQKLESVGQLAAGIAHEINTPIQYIGDNIRFIEESFMGLGKLIADYQKLASAVQSDSVTLELTEAVESSAKAADFEYLNQEIPLAVRQSLEGVARVTKIVNAMKEFSHPGQSVKVATDLNRAIDTAITVARGEWKYVAEVVTDFDATLPHVVCLPAEFNQVILNLLVNAAHAIAATLKNSEGPKGTITISTRHVDAFAEIRVADTGTGIPEAIRHRIFDPFFTTKGVGKGTGQGLAIAWAAIVDQHGGQLRVESTVGEGSTFIIRLPITPPVKS
jgi:two-component system NtrC family sensor kinase